MNELNTMIGNVKQQISEMMDGELDKDTINMLIKDKNIKNFWHRYHLISDVIHQRFPIHSQTQLSKNISESISNQPTVLSPVKNTSLPTYIRPIAGLAVAASVAVVAILGIQQFQSGGAETINQTAQVEIVQNRPTNMEFGVPVILPDVTSARPVQMQLQSDLRISRYILNHNEYQSNMRVQGVTPHIRLVTTGINE